MKQHSCKCGETDPTKFYPKNRSKCKVCANNYQKSRYRNFSGEERSEYIKNNSTNYTKWVKANVFQYRFLSARNRAYKKNIDFDITVEFLIELYESQGRKCYYSGIEFNHDDDYYSMSVDRIDSSKGYTKDNVVLACSIVNSMKNDLSVNDFISVVRSIVAYQDGA